MLQLPYFVSSLKTVAGADQLLPCPKVNTLHTVCVPIDPQLCVRRGERTRCRCFELAQTCGGFSAV